MLLAALLVACIDYEVTRELELQTWTQPAREGGVDILWVVDDSLAAADPAFSCFITGPK